MKRIILYCCLVLSLWVAIPNATWAESEELETKVTHIANVFEKLGEKVTLFFKFSKDSKFSYQKFLLEKRLAELKYVIESKEWQPVEETSSRYATYLSKFNNFVLENNLGSSKKDEIIKIYDRHSKILKELQQNFEYDGGWWLLLQHDINLIKQFLPPD